MGKKMSYSGGFVATRVCALLVVAFVTTSSTASAQTPSWLSNLRWSLDTASRRTEPLGDRPGSWLHVVGLDVHTIFSNGHRDVATLVFQPYVVGLNNVASAPFNFDDGDDTELTWRIANLNFTGLSNGGFNIRVGHFEVPFGLEQNLDTNGTLRQFSFSDRGIKTDWGVTVNGVLPHVDYEVALSRGSGVNYRSTFDPYLFSGRVGTSANANRVLGVSWLYGEVLTASRTVEQRRLGVDYSYYAGQWQWLAELSAGSRDGDSLVHALLESTWESPRLSWRAYGQIRESRRRGDLGSIAQSQATLGVDFEPNAHWAIGLQASHLFRSFSNMSNDTQLTAQIRWRL